MFEKDSEQDETVLPEVKKYPPIPPVKDPPVIGEPASLIIKALQDDGLDWTCFDSRQEPFFYIGVKSVKKSCEIYTRWNAYSDRLFCPGVDSFNEYEKQIIVQEIRNTRTRIFAREAEQERLATIELFKEYRNV